MIRAGSVFTRIIVCIILSGLLTSCFTTVPFTNANRGKPMDADKILAIVRIGHLYHIKLADSREVLMRVKSIDRDEMIGDMAVSMHSGDNFKNEAMEPNGVILLSNVSEIQTKKLSYPRTFLLIGLGVVIYFASERALSVSYK